MKKILLMIFMQVLALAAFSQTYIGYTTRNVNLRSGASTDDEVIELLKKNSPVYIDLDEEQDGWYLAVDIVNDIEGYVSKQYVKLYKSVSKTNSASIQKTRTTYSYDPSIHITNSTERNMTLRINSTTYKFQPKEERDVTMLPGRFNYRASSAGVVPASGSYVLESNHGYDWVFFIETRMRRR